MLPQSFLSKLLQFLRKAANHFIKLHLLLVHLLDLLPIDQHHICQKIIDHNIAVLFLLNNPIQFVIDSEDEDNAVFARCNNKLAARTKENISCCIDMIVLNVHDQWPLKPSKYNQFAIR